MKNTYHFLFENVRLNQKKNDLVIGSTTSSKAVRNHSLLVIHVLPHTRN